MNPNPPTPATRRPPWRLIQITAAVALAHWVVLQSSPLSLAAYASQDSSQKPNDGWSFATRTLAPEAAPARATEATPLPTAPSRRKTAAPRQSPVVETASDSTPSEKNAWEALAEQANDATNSIASSSTDVAQDTAKPVLLAAATQAPKASPTGPDTNASANAAPPPAKAVQKFTFAASTRLKYDIAGEVKGFPYHVNGELLWVQNGKTYDARMEISHFLLGSRVQTSTGQITGHGLQPTRFGDKVKSEVAAHFDYEKAKVTFSANTPDVPLLPGAQDQLSVLMQLGAMLAAEPQRFPAGTTLPVQAIGPRSAEAWVFHVGSLEQLALPGGELKGIRLWRDPLGTYDPKLEIWLAPDMGYLPVRIRLTQANGDVVDQQWRATQKP